MATAAEVKAGAKHAGQKAWVEWLGRIGLAGKGLSYGIVAILQELRRRGKL